MLESPSGAQVPAPLGGQEALGRESWSSSSANHSQLTQCPQWLSIYPGAHPGELTLWEWSESIVESTLVTLEMCLATQSDVQRDVNGVWSDLMTLDYSFIKALLPMAAFVP